MKNMPDNFYTQDCVVIEIEHDNGNGWNDRSCKCSKNKCNHHFICEKTIYPTFTLTENRLIEGTRSQAELICKSELTGKNHKHSS